MKSSYSIIRIISFLLLSVVIVVAYSQTKASGDNGIRFITSSDEFISENEDLSILLGNDGNLYQEYRALEKSCEGLSVKDVTDKAYPYYVKRQDIEKGMILHRIAVSKYRDNLSDEEKLYCTIAYANIGYYLIFEKNSPLQAYPYLAKSLQIANQICFTDKSPEHTKLVNAIVGINTNIAKVFAIYRDYSRAAYYYRNALDIAKKDNNPIAIPFAFTDLLHFVWTTDSLSSMKNEIIDFRNIRIPNNSLQTMYDYAKLMAAGAENYLNKNFDTASILVDSAANKYDIQVDDRRYPVFNRIIVGKIAFAKKDYTKAEEYFTNAEKIIRKEKLEDLYDLIYQLRADVYTATGNLILAEYYRNEGLRMRDSLYNLKSYSVLRDMELALHDKDHNKKLSGAYSETQRWKYIAMFFGVLIFIICALIVYIMMRNRKLKEHRECVFLKNWELIEAKKKYDKSNVATTGETQHDEESKIQDNLKTYQPSEPYLDLQTTGQDEVISDGDLNNIYQQILEYMANNADIFQPTFTIDSLVAALGLRIKQVSQAINSVGGKNFNTLLGEFRVKKACEKMMETYSEPSQRPTIEALAEDVGYKSRTHFMRVFKSVTGLTTTEFVKQVKKQKNRKD